MPSFSGSYILWGYLIRTEVAQCCSAQQRTLQAFAEPPFWSYRRISAMAMVGDGDSVPTVLSLLDVVVFVIAYHKFSSLYNIGI